MGQRSLSSFILILLVGAVSVSSIAQESTKSKQSDKKARQKKEHKGKRQETTLEEEPKQPQAVVDTAGEDADLFAQYAKLAAIGDDDTEEREVFFYECEHISGDNLKRILENFLTPSGMVSGSQEADIVVVSDVVSNIKQLKKIAEQVDRLVPQVLVESRLVEFTVDSQFEKEINLALQHFQKLENIPNGPNNYMDFVKRLTDSFVPAGTSPNNTQGSLSWARYDAKHHNLLTMFLKFLETRGRAKILSAPNLILRRGAEGSIITGEEVPIQTQTVTSGSVSTSTTFKPVGIKLRVTPVMIAGKKIRIKVSPEVSNVTRIDNSGAPIIAIRNANTELEMLDGQLISIGGLLRSEERVVERRVPILGSIPLLGHLFRGKETQSVRSQLVIFLSIRILDHDALETVDTVGAPMPNRVRKTMEKMDKRLQLEPTGIKKDWDKARDREAEPQSNE